MNLLEALMLSVVEGFTEFLPISSTAHLLIAGKLLGIDADVVAKSFYISIQCAAIASVALLYFSQFLKWETISRLIVAFIPTAVVGVTLYSIIKSVFFEEIAIIAWALIIGGIIMIVFERQYGRRSFTIEQSPPQPITYAQAFGIGLMQSIAVIPGVSRAGATIIGGMAVGVPRKQIVEFSFLLAVPTMLAATILDGVETLASFTWSDLPVFAVGFTGAFLTALASITWLLKYIRSHTFALFGYYRIAIGIITLLIIS